MKSAKIKAIIKRELKEKLFSKTFILMTVLIPGIYMLMIGIQAYMMSYDDDTQKQFMIVAENAEILSALEEQFSKENFDTEGSYHFEYKQLSQKKFENELKKLKPLLLDESITGVVFVPQTVLQTKKIFYYSKTPENKIVTLRLKKTIDAALVSQYFKGKGLNEDDLKFVKTSLKIREMKVTNKSITENSEGNRIVAFIFIFMLYLSLLTSGQMILRSVIEEKQNRIVEILLSSINSNELMSGKIIGSAVTSLAQMAIWILPVVVALSTSWITLPKEIAVSIPLWQWLYFMLNFFIGLLTFLGLFAAMGALFDNEQDAQSGMWPLLMLIMIPFFIAIALMENPSSPIGKIASLVPFASLFVMPERMSFLNVPTYEFLLSIIINLITLVILFPVSGKIYRTGILMTGKKPSWSEVIKWLKN